MRKWAWLGQWFAGLMMACGIGVEVAMHAPIGWIIITTGSLVAFLFTKLRRL